MHWRFQVRRCQGYLAPSGANFLHFHAILEKTIWPNNRLVPHLWGWHTHLGNIGPVIDMVLDQKSKSRLSVDYECTISGADPGFGQGGPPASETESCRRSEAASHERSEQSAVGVQGLLKGPGSFWVFNAQICILTHSRDSFSLILDIYFDTKC